MNSTLCYVELSLFEVLPIDILSHWWIMRHFSLALWERKLGTLWCDTLETASWPLESAAKHALGTVEYSTWEDPSSFAAILNPACFTFLALSSYFWYLLVCGLGLKLSSWAGATWSLPSHIVISFLRGLISSSLELLFHALWLFQIKWKVSLVPASLSWLEIKVPYTYMDLDIQAHF